MFCKYCGKETENEVCDECAAKNAEEVKVEAVETIKETTSNTTTAASDAKSKLVAGLLGIFLGGFGVHNFYLGYTGKAIAQLLITLISCGTLAWASAIWGLVEGIMVLTGSISVDGQGNPLKD